MRAILVLAAALACAAAVLPLRVLAQEQGAYCASGSAALLNGFSPQTVAALRDACRPGDTITIPSRSDFGPGAIAILCDFSKAVVVTPNAVVCQFVAPRSVRQAPLR